MAVQTEPPNGAAPRTVANTSGINAGIVHLFGVTLAHKTESPTILSPLYTDENNVSVQDFEIDCKLLRDHYSWFASSMYE